LGVNGWPAHTVHVEALPVRKPLLVEEVFERAMEVVKEARVVDDLRVVLVSEAHANPAGERHGAPSMRVTPSARIPGALGWRYAARWSASGGRSTVVGPRRSSSVTSCATISVSH